jgi:hypothetical protein
MKRTDMDFQQVIEFTGLERRFATEQEIELLVTKSASTFFEQLVERNKIPLADQPAQFEKIIQQLKSEWLANSFVLDFKSVGKRLIFHHQLVVGLQDHEEIKKFFDNAGITSDMVDHTSSVLGEEFKEAVKRSTTTHNHICVGHYCLLIDAHDNVIYQNGYDLDICLRETQKKEKETASTSEENKS